MKKAFTLIELLVVTLVIAILASILFKLAGSVEGQSELQTTIIRMQKLENCLSGYYAAFGCYPPVPLQGRSRNPFYPMLVQNGKMGPLIQDTEAEPNYSVYDYNTGAGSVEAACRAQPLMAVFPYTQNIIEKCGGVSPADGWNETIRSLLEDDPEMAKSFEPYTAGTPFTGDDGSGNDGSTGDWRWPDKQKFCFGLMSFLLPRYLLMMGCENSDLYALYQWDGNNSLPCRFDSGVSYGSWAELNDELKVDPDSNQGQTNRRKVELIPSQAITQRWLPNLEKICAAPAIKGEGNQPLFEFYNIDVGGETLAADPRHPDMISKYIYLPGGTGKSPNVLTVNDGWQNEFFYYSPPPYQSYRLWSAGPNMVTFPPWFTEEEMKVHNDKKMSYMVLYKFGSLPVKEAIADDIVHLSH